jgi:hypothetical protein
MPQLRREVFVSTSEESRVEVLTEKKNNPPLPPIASCPSCGRRPSERVAIGWAPHYAGPTTLACSDAAHDQADLGPFYSELVARLWNAGLAELTGPTAEPDPGRVRPVERVARQILVELEKAGLGP